MKKFLLPLLLLSAFVLCFSSCETETTDIVVGGVPQYSVIRSDKILDTDDLSYIVDLMNSISDAVKEKCGCDLVIDNDWVKRGSEPDPAKKEILVGDTNRPETAEVSASLGNSLFAVREVGNKIVIVGKSDYALSLAVEHFINTYINGSSVASDGTLALKGKIDYLSGSLDFLEISNYEIVHTRDCKDIFQYSYYDYSFDEQTVAHDLATTISRDHGVDLKVTMDYVYPGIEDEYGILLGRCEREETEAVKSTLAYNEYAVKVVGKKIVVTGHGFITTYAAIEKFEELLGRFSLTEDGKTTLAIPEDYSYVGVLEGAEDWDLTVPVYSGGESFSVSDLGDGAYLVKVDGTDKKGYNAYVSELEKSGFVKYTDNELSGNLFSTYRNDKSVVHVQYAPVYERVTVSVEPASVPLFALEKDKDTSVVTTPKLIQLKVSDEASENGGMCYIIRLENGKFIVVDCGQEEETSNLIYEQLREHNVLEGDPQIYAWIFTHWHGDHYLTYTKYFFPQYGAKVKIENFIYSYPMDRYYSGTAKLTSYNGFKNTTKIGNIIRPHAGDVMHLGNMKLTFLYTQDEFLPRTFEFFNDSSLTFMLEYEGQKILITGDASENSCNIMLDMYGEDLKCDILQVPHHGHYGANNAFMDATDPAVALIPASAVRWEKKLTQDFYWGAAPLRYLLASKNVKEYYVQGMGTVTFDLPYKISE